MASLLSNLSEVIHKNKCEYGHDEYANFKDDLIEYKC